MKIGCILIRYFVNNIFVNNLLDYKYTFIVMKNKNYECFI